MENLANNVAGILGSVTLGVLLTVFVGWGYLKMITPSKDQPRKPFSPVGAVAVLAIIGAIWLWGVPELARCFASGAAKTDQVLAEYGYSSASAAAPTQAPGSGVPTMYPTRLPGATATPGSMATATPGPAATTAPGVYVAPTPECYRVLLEARFLPDCWENGWQHDTLLEEEEPPVWLTTAGGVKTLIPEEVNCTLQVNKGLGALQTNSYYLTCPMLGLDDQLVKKGMGQALDTAAQAGTGIVKGTGSWPGECVQVVCTPTPAPPTPTPAPPTPTPAPTNTPAPTATPMPTPTPIVPPDTTIAICRDKHGGLALVLPEKDEDKWSAEAGGDWLGDITPADSRTWTCLVVEGSDRSYLYFGNDEMTPAWIPTGAWTNRYSFR